MILEGIVSADADSAFMMEAEERGKSLYVLHIKKFSSGKVEHCPISLKIRIKNVKGVWRPSYDREFSIHNRFSSREPVLVNFDSPVREIFDFNDLNIAAVALDPENLPAIFSSEVLEETGELNILIDVYGIREEVRLIIDISRRHYSSAIGNVVKWMMSQADGNFSVTEYSHLPLYSTWYAYHQNISMQDVKRESSLAAALGFGTMIIDDGWQTSDNSRGYRFCGDWMPSTSKIPDMKSITDHIHSLGMRAILWYSIPFVGSGSSAYEQFKFSSIGKFGDDVVIVNPSEGKYLEYMRKRLGESVDKWGFDGIKADFIDQWRRKDSFPAPEIMLENAVIGEKTLEFLSSLFEGYVERSLDVEFRQFYFGPLIQKFCTMIRADDCPFDPVENRIRTINLRLCTRGPAVHSDPISWHEDEPVEDVIRYLLNCLHSVLQISVRLEEQKPGVLDALKFWLSFSREHYRALIYGEIEPGSPSGSYPYVSVSDQREEIITFFEQVTVHMGDRKTPCYVINATTSPEIGILASEEKRYRADLFDCSGRFLGSRTVVLNPGQNILSIPVSGLMILNDS